MLYADVYLNILSFVSDLPTLGRIKRSCKVLSALCGDINSRLHIRIAKEASEVKMDVIPGHTKSSKNLCGTYPILDNGRLHGKVEYSRLGGFVEIPYVNGIS